MTGSDRFDRGGVHGKSTLEQSLRAMLVTDAERIQERDLRPPAAFPPARSARPRRTRTLAAVTCAAAATAALLMGTRLLATSGTDGNRAATIASPTATVQAPLWVTFTPRTTRLTQPRAATVTAPVARVQATNQQVGRRVQTGVDAEISDIVAAFGNRIGEQGIPPRALYLRATATTTTWRHFLSVRFDSVSEVGMTREDGSDFVLKEYAVLVFDTRSGARVSTPDLFTDLDQVDAIVRKALVAAIPGGGTARADQLDVLSLNPAKAGKFFAPACELTDAGLHCLVDDGAFTPDYRGRLESTVPWSTLAPLLRPGVRD